MPQIPRAHLVSRSRYEIATSSRICGGKAPTRRVNVNVLTRLPKIRAVPAPIRPLNSTPVYSPHQAQSSVHLWTVGCWGFDVGEGSNGIKDPILCPFFSPRFPIPGSSIWLIMQQKSPFSLLFAPANKQRLHVFCQPVLPATSLEDRQLKQGGGEVASDDGMNHRLDIIKNWAVLKSGTMKITIQISADLTTWECPNCVWRLHQWCIDILIAIWGKIIQNPNCVHRAKSNGTTAFNMTELICFPLPAVCFEPGKSLTFPSLERKGIGVPDYVLVSAQASAIDEHGGANVLKVSD